MRATAPAHSKSIGEGADFLAFETFIKQELPGFGADRRRARLTNPLRREWPRIPDRPGVTSSRRPPYGPR